MIIQCPKCHKKYDLDRAHLAKGSIKVRCPSCKNTWVIKAEFAKLERKPAKKETKKDQDRRSRYLHNSARPAQHIKQLLEMEVAANKLTQIFLIHTARAHDVLHDFITEIYWAKYSVGATLIRRQDALDFLERAANNGIITPRWSETMMLRVARYLTGCLTDFQLAGDDHAGKREILPFTIDTLTTLYLAYDIHFSGFSDNSLIEHEDWRLFGFETMDVRNELERSGNGHFIPQYSGELIRISWKHKTMEEALRGIVTTGF